MKKTLRQEMKAFRELLKRLYPGIVKRPHPPKLIFDKDSDWLEEQRLQEWDRDRLNKPRND